MSPLFSEAGSTRLDEFAKPGLLCAFDFDGTLAPIVATPDQARLPAEIRQLLLELSAYAPVAIITGRSVADIRSRLGFDPDFIIGNHGLEGVPGWEAHAQRHRTLCAGWRAGLARQLNAGKGWDPAIQIEDKCYSLSVHYRGAHDSKETAAHLMRAFAELDPPPRVVAGKYVFNLVPLDGAHKGTALEQLMQEAGARRALYVGDDVTDEDAFRLPRRGVLSVRIEHAPDSAAEFYLPRPADITHLLVDLIARLRAQGALNWVETAVAGST